MRYVLCRDLNDGRVERVELDGRAGRHRRLAEAAAEDVAVGAGDVEGGVADDEVALLGSVQRADQKGLGVLAVLLHRLHQERRQLHQRARVAEELQVRVRQRAVRRQEAVAEAGGGHDGALLDQVGGLPHHGLLRLHREVDPEGKQRLLGVVQRFVGVPEVFFPDIALIF